MVEDTYEPAPLTGQTRAPEKYRLNPQFAFLEPQMLGKIMEAIISIGLMTDILTKVEGWTQ